MALRGRYCAASHLLLWHSSVPRYFNLPLPNASCEKDYKGTRVCRAESSRHGIWILLSWSTQKSRSAFESKGRKSSHC